MILTDLIGGLSASHLMSFIYFYKHFLCFWVIILVWMPNDIKT